MKSRRRRGYFCIIKPRSASQRTVFVQKENSILLWTNWTAHCCVSKPMEQATPQSLWPDQWKARCYRKFRPWYFTKVRRYTMNGPFKPGQKHFAWQMNITYFLVPLSQITFWHSDTRRAFACSRMFRNCCLKDLFSLFCKFKVNVF